MSLHSWSIAHSVGLPLKSVTPESELTSRRDSSIVLTAMRWASRLQIFSGSRSLTRAPSVMPRCGAISCPHIHSPRTLIRLAVSVPVLSEQMVVADPIVSHASRCLTKLFSLIILRDEKASARLTARGSPSGTATASTVIAVTGENDANGDHRDEAEDGGGEACLEDVLHHVVELHKERRRLLILAVAVHRHPDLAAHLFSQGMSVQTPCESLSLASVHRR
eukprot:4862875-Pleurochrysis_carterae.AAC.2